MIPRRFFFAFALLGALCAAGHARPASAQSQTVTVSKILCYATPGCPSNPTGESTVTALTPVFYQITIGNTSSSPQTVSLSDVLPANFVLVPPVACGTQTNTVGGTTTVSGIVLAPNGSVTCVLNGQFNATAPSVQNVATVTGTATLATSSNTDTVAVTLPNALPGNVSITKSASVAVVNAPGTVTYTIQVMNTSTNAQDPALVLGNVLTIYDELRLWPSSVPLKATYVAGSATCSVAPAVTNSVTNSCVQPAPQPGSVSPLTVNSPALMPFLNWRYATGDPGLLGPGAVMTLTYTVNFSALPGVPCVIQPNSDGVFNRAHVALNVPGPSNTVQAVQDQNPLDSTSTEAQLQVITGFTIVNPVCGLIYLAPSTVLKVTKIRLSPPMPPNGYPWTTPSITFHITVKNISTYKKVTRIRGLDETVAGLGTPPFTSSFVAAPCPPAIPTIMNCVVNPTQSLLGYGDTKVNYQFARFPTALSPVLNPGQSTSFNIKLKYTQPNCDSYPGVAKKPIDNVAVVLQWREIVGNTTTTVNGMVGDSITSYMKKPPLCPLKVLKTASVPKIHFGVPNGPPSIVYTVKYYNPTPGTYTVGTLIDTMRTKTVPPGPTPYAAQLPVQYRSSCTKTPGVTGGFSTPYPYRNSAWPGYNNATIIPTALPQQGVRLIQNTSAVTFGPLSSMTCTVQVVVLPPPPSDPYCSMHGYLENAGILDASAYYNPNFAWTSPPTWMWSSVSQPLPKCYDLLLNKVAVPATAWTSPNGGPVTFAISILNNGNDAIVGGGPIVQDAFTPPLFTSSVPPLTGSPSTPLVSAAWIPPLPTATSTSRIGINTLAAGQSILANLTVANTSAHPYPAAPGQICNDLARYMNLPPNGPYPGDYYWKHPASAHVCIPVLQTGSLTVTKALVQPSYGNVSSTATFTVAVSCALSSSVTGPNTTLALTIPNPTQTINGIPIGSSCSVVETSVPPPTQDPVCNNWIWTQTGMSPSSPVVIPASGSATVVITNTRTCHNLFSFGVVKTVVGVPGMIPPTGTFTVNTSCQGPGGTPVVNSVLTLQTPNGLTQYTPSTLDVGWTCTISEVPPPPFVLPSGTQCTWVTTYPQGTNSGSLSGPQTLSVVNTLNCPHPRPGPNAVPAQRFIVGDFLFARRVYNEFSPGNSGGGASFELRGAVEFPAFGLPWMVEGDYRSYGYSHTSRISAAATSGPAGPVNPCPHSGLPPAALAAVGDPGCVTVIGVYGQTAVPSFSARDVDFDGRLAVQIAKPRIYVGVGYLHREENYGYPAQNGFGFGAEKLPDLENRFSAYGSVWYYPSISGNFTYPVAGAPPALAGTSTKLDQRFLKYELGATYNLGTSGLFLDAGIKGDTIRGTNPAPSDASHAGGYIGLGIKF